MSEKINNNLCNICPISIRGICCYFYTEIIDDAQRHWKISLSKHPCKYFNTKTKKCKIYKKRHMLNPNCLTIKEMIIKGTVPKECSYVLNDKEYQKRQDIIITKLPDNIPKNIRKEYEELNNLKHSEISSYDTLRTAICPKCESPELEEFWGEKFSLLFFSYRCQSCGYEWDNFLKQVNYSLKKLRNHQMKV